MTASDHDHTDPPPGSPLLDPRVLRELAEDVGARAAASFAREFAGMWPRRRSALAHALAHDDADGAMEAVLSMRVSSAMVGARRLEELATRLETSLRRRGLAGAAPFIDDVEHCGEETAHALSAQSESGHHPW